MSAAPPPVSPSRPSKPVQPPLNSAGPHPASATWQPASPSELGRMVIGGDWQLSCPVPSWDKMVSGVSPKEVLVSVQDLGTWDTSLVLFIIHAQTWCLKARITFRTESLPPQLPELLSRFTATQNAIPVRLPTSTSVWARYRSVTEGWTAESREAIAFLGECTLGFLNLVRFPHRFRWLDFIIELQQTWASSLPIVALVSILIGVVLAFQAALQLQQFGAAIFVADLVGLSVVREMGPMMAAVIVAGRNRTHHGAG